VPVQGRTGVAAIQGIWRPRASPGAEVPGLTQISLLKQATWGDSHSASIRGLIGTRWESSGHQPRATPADAKYGEPMTQRSPRQGADAASTGLAADAALHEAATMSFPDSITTPHAIVIALSTVLQASSEKRLPTRSARRSEKTSNGSWASWALSSGRFRSFGMRTSIRRSLPTSTRRHRANDGAAQE
jgi:hypothetical protein